jgi:PAS domain S-box-containing protein
MPSIHRTLRKQASESTEPTPQVHVSGSSSGREDRRRGGALAHTAATSTRLFKGWFAQCLLAVIAVALAFVARLAFAQYGKLPPYTTFYPVVLLATIIGGIWAGLLTTGLCALAAVYWLLPSIDRFANSPALEAISTAIFCVTGVCVSIVAELYKRERERLAEANEQLRAEIAERGKVHEALRRAVEFDEAALKSLGEGLYTLDTNGLVTSMNPAAEELLGWSFAELRGKEMHDMTHHHYRDGRPFPSSECASIQLLTHDGKPLKNHEDVFIRKDGTFFDVVHSVAPTRDAARQITGLVVVFTDITERKRAEEALRVSEEKFTKAFARNQAAVSINRLTDGVFLEVNDTLLELSGYSREEMIGHSSRRLMWPTRGACARCLRKLREKGSLRNWEQDFVKKSGEIFVTELSAQICILNGKKLVVTTLVDITDRKRAEKALEDSEGQLRLALDAANSGIWEWNLRTNKSKWSADFWRLHNLPRSSEPSYDSWLSSVHPQDREMAQQTVREAADSSAELNLEYRVVDENGGVRWLAARGRPLLDGGGDAVSYIGIVTDISSRKRTDEALLRTEKLAATGRLAATIAHEVNNPLAAAMNTLYLASSDPGLNTSTKEYLTIADQELRRAAHMTQQTLGFYRATGSPTPVALPKLIDDVLGVYATKLQNRNITVHRRYRCNQCVQECQACFIVSAGEMRQIISNLLANGMDALNDNGTLYIRASRTNSLNESGPHIHLTIADNGCGVRKEHLTRIFEPFFTTKESFGTGLGLWVTQELVRKHHGVIRVRSSKDRGTVFRITFPAMPASGTKKDSLAAA